MNIFKRIAIVLVGAVCCSACIDNDIPYPVEEINILTYEGEGFTAAIDPLTHTVTLYLEEQTNIRAVEVKNATITEGGSSSMQLTGSFDLRSPLEVVLSKYQEYVWTIRAEQPIERYFTVAGQVGESVIDAESRTATAYVAEGSDLGAVSVTSLKLGPKDVTRMTPSAEELTEFYTVRYVYLQYPALSGEEERWQLYVLETDVKVQITQVDAWGKIAWLYGAAQEGTTVGFRYRKSGDAAWIDAPAPTVEGGSFKLKLTGLEPLTEYEFVAFSNDDVSPVMTTSTEAVPELVNGGFEEWCVIKDIVYPYAQNPYWATGNVGASIVGETLTEGVSDIRPNSKGKYSARLSSKYANMLGIGKFAAGNLYIGSYVRNDGTNGIVHFGRPFVARPTALKGWLKFNCGAIDKIGSVPPGVTINMGDMDCGMIYIALGDWDPATYGGSTDSPVEIATRYIDQTAFNPNSEAVIAYGEMALTESVGDWKEFEIPLEYRATDRKPTHMFIVCSASRYGDYFTGSTKSVLWLDDFELIYE